jgi:hypothetical protein
VFGGGEAREIGADLGDQHLGDGTTDAGNGIQPRNDLLVRAHARTDLGTHLGDALVQDVDVAQLLGHQEALVRTDAPDECLFSLRELFAQSTVGELGQCGAVGLPRDQRRQDVPPRCRWRPRHA